MTDPVRKKARELLRVLSLKDSSLKGCAALDVAAVALRAALDQARARQKADEALLALPLAPWGIALEWQEDGVDCVDWTRHGHDNPDSSWASRRVSFDTEADADEFIDMCGQGPIPVQMKPRRIAP